MDDAARGVGPRIAAFLRARYPRDRAKLIAREFDVSPGTAELWIAGKPPAVWHLEAMYLHFGEPFARALFVEAFAAGDDRIRQLEEALAAQRDAAPSAPAPVPPSRMADAAAPPAVSSPQGTSPLAALLDQLAGTIRRPGARRAGALQLRLDLRGAGR